MAQAVKETKEEKFSSDRVLDLYANLTIEIWEIVSALIGEAILSFLFTLAIRKIEEKYRFLNSLKVSEEGISLDEVRKDCRKIAPLEIHRGFQSLINQLSHLFSTLTEGVINKELLPKVLPKVREAERMISQK
jgi:predicted ferric reductase